MSGLTIWTIYYDPLDYPGKFVVRRRLVDAGQTYIAAEPDAVADTLEQARKCLNVQLLTCIRRSPHDDVCIVESWL